MNDLIERYVSVATRHLPERARADATRDIRVMIDEMIEARVTAGEGPDVAETAVLNELGDPRKVARSFEDQPRFLIGPRYYEQYTWLVRTLLAWVPGVAFLAQLLVNVLTDDQALVQSFVQGGLRAAWTAIVVAIQIVFWVTLTFAIMERAEPSGTQPETGDAWSVADLPSASPSRQISPGEAAWVLGAMFVVGTLLIVQNVRGIGAFIRSDEVAGALEGRAVPFFNPGIPAWMTFSVLVLVALTAIAEMLKFAVGNWTLPVAVAEIITSFLWIAVPAVVIWQWGLVNQEITRIWDHQVADWLAGSGFERVMITVLVVISVWSIAEAIRGYRAHRKTATRSSDPNEDFVFIV
jgi:hypothetical protein